MDEHAGADRHGQGGAEQRFQVHQPQRRQAQRRQRLHDQGLRLPEPVRPLPGSGRAASVRPADELLQPVELREGRLAEALRPGDAGGPELPGVGLVQQFPDGPGQVRGQRPEHDGRPGGDRRLYRLHRLFRRHGRGGSGLPGDGPVRPDGDQGLRRPGSGQLRLLRDGLGAPHGGQCARLHERQAEGRGAGHPVRRGVHARDRPDGPGRKQDGEHRDQRQSVGPEDRRELRRDHLPLGGDREPGGLCGPDFGRRHGIEPGRRTAADQAPDRSGQGRSGLPHRPHLPGDLGA